MAYPGVDWKNKPDHTSPINRTNLEIMDNGITENDKRITQLYSDLKKITGNEMILPSYKDRALSTGGTTVNLNVFTTLSGCNLYIIDCSEGDVFEITASSTGSYRIWCFIDTASNVLSNAAANASVTNLLLTAPANSYKLIVNDRSGSGSVVKNQYLIEKVNTIKTSLDDTNAVIGIDGLQTIYNGDGIGTVYNQKKAGANGIVNNSSYYCIEYIAYRDSILYATRTDAELMSLVIYSGEPSSSTYKAEMTTMPTISSPRKIKAGDHFCINYKYAAGQYWSFEFSGNQDVVMSEHLLMSETQIENIKTEFEKITTNWTYGKFVSAITGVVMDGGTYYISDYIYCHNCKAIKFKPHFHSTALGFGFYDIDKRVVSYGNNNDNLSEITVTVPDNAYYFVTTSTINTDPILYLQYNQQSLGKDFTTSDNPVKNKVIGGGMTALLRVIGFIGDSLMSGCSYYMEDGTAHGGDRFDWSWGAFLSREIGAESHFFSRGGLTTRTWLREFYNTTTFSNNPCQAYYIGLGVNDAAASTHVNIGTSEDINLDDPTQNPDTFYGNYGKIISYIKSIVPIAKIFVITDPRGVESEGYNDAIRYMATIFDNVYVIDLKQKAALLYLNAHLGDTMWISGHLTITGYRVAADHIMSYTDYIIRNNMSDFLDLIDALS